MIKIYNYWNRLRYIDKIQKKKITLKNNIKKRFDNVLHHSVKNEVFVEKKSLL